MTAIKTLCSIISQRGSSTKATFRDQIGFDWLLTTGLIRSGGVAQSICCEACENPHDAPVVYEDSTYGHYCDHAGFVPLADTGLTVVQPNIGKLVAHLADTFDCRRRKTSEIANSTWRVGAVKTTAGDIAIYFRPTMQSHEDIQDLQTALSREIRSQFTLVLTANGMLATGGARTVVLDEIIDVSQGSNGIALTADPCEIVGVPKKAQGGQPSPYTQDLETMMRKRVSNGDAMSGRNEEARALANLYLLQFPEKNQPSLSAIKRHVTRFRTGSEPDHK